MFRQELLSPPFYTSLRPTAILCKIFGVFPLQNLRQNKGSLVRYRLFSFSFVWGILLHTVALIAVMESRWNSWSAIGFPFTVAKTVGTIFTTHVYLRYLPSLFTIIEQFDTRSHDYKVYKRESWAVTHLGQIWMLTNITTIFMYTLANLSSMSHISVMGVVSTLSGSFLSISRQLYCFTYLYLCSHLTARLRSLKAICHRQMKHIFESDTTAQPELVLEYLRLLYALLGLAVRTLSRAYGLPLVVYIATIFSTILVHLYRLMYSHDISVFSQVVFNTYHVSSLILVAGMSDRLASAGLDIAYELQNVPLNRITPKCQWQIQVFFSQLAVCPIQVSAAGFCTLNNGILVSILLALATYFIVIVQFSADIMAYKSDESNTTFASD